MRRVLFLVLLLASAAGAQPRAYDFSTPDDLKIVQSYAAPGGVTSGARVSIEDGALLISNRAPGSFGVQFNLVPLDVDQITDLDFDFKASPDARVNWFFRVGKTYYGVRFTGPAGVRPGAVELGDAEISAGKNGWKHAHIPLRAWMRAALPKAQAIRIEEILVGNWDNDNYLMAGIGGNGPGASWQMDDLKLEKRVETAKFGPARFEGENFVVPARDLASFDFGGLKLGLEGIGDYTDAAQFFQPSRGLVVPLGAKAQSGTVLRDGQTVAWKLTRAADAVVAQGTARYEFSNAPVALPTLQIGGASASGDDMEVGFSGWSSGDAALELDETSAASGTRSLRLTNRRSASRFAVAAPATSLDAAKFPVLTFAYRADDRLRTDLHFKWNGKPYSIRFTDRDAPDPRVASVDAVTPDNSWHLASVNLLSSLRAARADAPDFTVTDLEFADAGWLGNAKGVQWWLDDWRPAPLVTGELNAKVTSRDLSGVRGVAWVFDQKAATKPDERANGAADLKIDLSDKKGLWWLHVRAQNGAGQWSEAAHFPVYIGEK